MSRYAEGTEVPVEKTQMEIGLVLKKYGAEGYGFFQDGDRGIIAFKAHNRQVRFTLPLPHIDSDEVRKTKKIKYGYASTRTNAQAEAYREQLMRQRWRCLLLAIKAKLEAVESNITSFEEEFLAHICLPNGQTAGAWLRPQIEQAYTSGKPILLLE